MAGNTKKQLQSKYNTIYTHRKIDYGRISLNTLTMMYRKDSYNVEYSAKKFPLMQTSWQKIHSGLTITLSMFTQGLLLLEYFYY